MRKHEYPIPASDSEDKENVENYRDIDTGSQSPITPKRDLHNSNWNPDIPDGAFVKYTSPQTESYAARRRLQVLRSAVPMARAKHNRLSKSVVRLGTISCNTSTLRRCLTEWRTT